LTEILNSHVQIIADAAVQRIAATAGSNRPGERTSVACG